MVLNMIDLSRGISSYTWFDFKKLALECMRKYKCKLFNVIFINDTQRKCQLDLVWYDNCSWIFTMFTLSIWRIRILYMIKLSEFQWGFNANYLLRTFFCIFLINKLWLKAGTTDFHNSIWYKYLINRLTLNNDNLIMYTEQTYQAEMTLKKADINHKHGFFFWIWISLSLTERLTQTFPVKMFFFLISYC